MCCVEIIFYLRQNYSLFKNSLIFYVEIIPYLKNR